MTREQRGGSAIAAGFKLDPEERAALSAQVDQKLLEGLAAMERFTRRFLDRLGADYAEPARGVLHVPADKRFKETLKKEHLLVFDPAVYPDLEERHAELLTPASPFFRNMLAQAESVGPVGIVSTRRATPYTMFHFHVHLKGLNFEWEELVTIAVDDDADPVPDPPTVRELLEALDPARNGGTAAAGPGAAEAPDGVSARLERAAQARRGAGFTPRRADDVPEGKRRVPEAALEAAPRLLRQTIAPRLDELAGAVETGLQKTMERLAAYYEQMRDESRRDDVKLRRRIGEINAKIWYTEDKFKLRRLEKERDLLSEELAKVKKRSQRALTQLEVEEEERLAKEAERARPDVRIRLVGATRVVPE